MQMGQFVIATAGQLLAFPGYPDEQSGRLPVAHQFVSLGDTVEERNARSSSYIPTETLLLSL